MINMLHVTSTGSKYTIVDLTHRLVNLFNSRVRITFDLPTHLV